MPVEILLLAGAFAAGLAAQRAASDERLRRCAWNLFFWTVSPAVVFYAFSTVPLDAGLGLALAAAILASYLTICAGWAYGRLVSRERDEQGALALAAGFPNTGFIGYPLAQMALGAPGLALMVLYDRLAWLVPGSAVSTTIARLHGRRERTDGKGRARALLLNPPLLAALAASALRLAGLDAGQIALPLGHAAGEAIGPVGFFLLGFNLPLEAPAHCRGELRRAVGALAIRFAVGPLALLACGAALGASIPAAFYLGAAMPCAFHLMVLARVFDVRPALMRLLIVSSTVPAVVAVAAASVVFR